MLIGLELKQARRELGLTQKELANELEVSLPTVVNWELGKSTPRGQNRQKLEAFFNEKNTEDELISAQINDALQVVSDDLGFDDLNDMLKTIIRKHNLGLLDL
ncbi:MAG: helix-turn-helix transcriptional regulator [Candidatus Marinimicrobia bacterium]|nr:helix-turn-helix transcriptional regulator [Candidatus Neomarinimicrobiota bacterium]